MIAEVIINSIAKDLNKEFHYIIPEEMEEKAKIGCRVYVSFGRMKSLEEGFITGILKESKYATKKIEAIKEQELTENNIKLAKLMARRYFCNVSDCVKLMLPPGTLNKDIKLRAKEKTGNFVYLKKDIEEIEFEIETGKIKNPKQIRTLNFLVDNDGTHISDLEVLVDIKRNTINTLEKNGYIEIIEQKIERNPFKNKEIKRDEPLKLTDEQEKAFNNVKECIEEKKYKEFLIYGVTGSGKTEVYLQLINEVIKKGKKAIMLVPEISLTPQMVNRFIARFGEKIAVLHSKLSIGERFDQWQKIKNDEVSIIIGARSAIFAPAKNLGIVIIDEEHDLSYKSDTNPRYNAKDIANYICKTNNIPLVLGSATPDINTFYNTKNNKIELLKLSKRATGSKLPDVTIVDLRNELANGNNSIISNELYKKIEENLKNKYQTILFLNRRGYSTSVMCRECGYVMKCKNCNITLTYHMNEDKLKCHYCGYEMRNVKKCPGCKSEKIKYFGIGTQKLEEEIKKMFANVTTIRMDVDTVSKKNSHENIINKFKEENIDILIGTQMVVKGHHFPKVTLVGVIAADSSLNIDDYRASERTFQILTQVEGRAGREKLPGYVIVQTYNPDNFSIEYAKKQDYDLFYNTEILLRKQLKYPPFCDIILINVSDRDNNIARKVTEQIYSNLKENQNMSVYRPQPSPINKIKNKYRWRIIIKCKLNNNIINELTEAVNIPKLYKTTRIIVDVNPNNMS